MDFVYILDRSLNRITDLVDDVLRRHKAEALKPWPGVVATRADESDSRPVVGCSPRHQ